MPIAAAIGAAGSILSGAIGNIGSKRATKEYNKGQMELAQMNNQWNAREAEKARSWEESMMDKQNAWNLEQWNRENEYNSASAQADRFRAAGLNPALVMGGDAGTASSISSASPGSVSPPTAQMPSQVPFTPNLNFIGEAINSFFTNKMTAESTRATELNNQLIKQFGSDKALADIAAAVDGRFEFLSPAYRKARQVEAPNMALNDITERMQQVRNLKEVGRLTSAQAIATSLSSDGQKILNKYLDASNQVDLMVKSSTWFSQVASGRLSYQQLKKNIAETAKIQAETQGIRLDNKKASALANSFVNAMKMEYEARSSELGSLIKNGVYETEAAARYYNAFNNRFDSENRAGRRMSNPRTERFLNDWSDYLEKLFNIRIFK